MKLALYLPNFRDKVTVEELEDLTRLAEELEFDSVWTLDRIVVPEASDRQELQYPFGMMTDFPPALPVSSRGEWFQGFPLLSWLAAKTTKLRIGMSIIDTPYRAPGVRTPAEFLELMQAQIAGPEKIGEFVEKYPQYVPILQAIDSVPPPRSWATVAFNSINSFKLVNADGAEQYVRWRLVPEAGEQELPKSERDGADQDYLMTGIFDELPVHYALRAQLAEEGDPVDDATIAFPAERRWVDMGVIELTGPDLERERDGDLLVNDPMRLTDGIEPSDDPILHVRPRVYDRSIRRGNGTPRPDEQQ